MKTELLNALMFASKQAFRIFLIQVLALQFLFANTSTSQKLLKETTISIQGSAMSLEQVFEMIESQTDFTFTYGSQVLSDKTLLSLRVEDASLQEVLETVAKESKYNFRRINNTIYAVPRKKKAKIEITEEFQDRNIQGKVQDAATGEPLIGATVQVKNTTIGTVTDIDGNFRLGVADDAETLIVSFIGFVSQEVPMGNQTTFDISMEQDVSALDEVVVVGYGEQKKANLTGAVTKVTGELINKRPITQGSQTLQGLAPGVFVNTNSGEPGNDNASIIIRGIGTLNDAEPLILIDGIEAPIDNLNPLDIESINVLKDAASASIYGTRAANGVILITTKRGASGKPTLSYDFYGGITSPTVLPDMVSDNRTYLETFRTAAEYSGRRHNLTDELIDEYDQLPSTDYLDEFIGTGSIMNHNLALSGGTDRVKYYWSTGYLDQESFLEGDYYLQRLNSRLNVDFKLSEKVTVGTSLAYTNTDNRLTTKADASILGATQFNPFVGKGSFLYTNIIASNPHVLPRDEFGRYGEMESGTGRSSRYNPAGIVDNEWIDIQSNDFLGNAFAEYEPLEGLKFRYTTGVNFQQESFEETRLQFEQYNRFGQLGSLRNFSSMLRTRESSIINFTNWIQGSYEKQLDNHFLKILVGFNQETSDVRRIANWETGFGSTSLVNSGNGTINDIANTNGEWVLSSIFSRINYDFGGKYLIEFNLRRDGSSRFGSNNRWGTFPGISAGYIISNESFWNVSFVDFLKLRGSWGKLGVQSTNLFPFASEIVLGTDYNDNSGAALVKLGNPDLQWEETTTLDLGIDVAFWEGRFSLEADYFWKESDGILTDLRNSLVSGISQPTSINAASIENEGVELALNFKQTLRKFKINASVNVTHIQNEVTQINPELTSGDDQFLVNGSTNVWWIRNQPINVMYGHKFAGIFQTDEFNDDGSLIDGTDYSLIGTPRPGDIKFTDQNGDGVINDDDRVVIGNRNPEWLYGFTLDLQYGNFDFSTLIQGIGEANAFISRYTGNFGHAGLRKYWLNGWTEENPSNEVPRIFVDRDGFNGRTITSLNAHNSFWSINRSYVRLKNISIGYAIPSKALSNLPISYARLYLSGQNLITLTDLEDLDPERIDNENHFTSALPQAKSFILGVNLKF